MPFVCVAAAVAVAGAVSAPVHAQRAGHWVYRDASGEIIQQRGGSVSVAHQWSEAMLDAIRVDFARPTIHARNLHHVSAAMWDAWAAYDDQADTYFHHESATAGDVQAAREEAISYACYRLLSHRFANSPGAATAQAGFDSLMGTLGYDISYTNTVDDNPAALGNRIAATIIAFGMNDGANEKNGYANEYYDPLNPPLLPELPGNPDIMDPNRWQPLALDFFVDQSGNIIPTGFPDFLSPEWGAVAGFALKDMDRTVYQRDGFDYEVFHDPGPPPLINGVGDDYYRWGFEMVSVWSSHLDPADGVMIDISPNTFGNSPLPDVTEWASYYDFEEGGDWSPGRAMNPVTGQPYPVNMVPRGDYTRILAEFWADGPDSETPPGHWFTLLNYVSEHPQFEKRFGGTGPILDDLEWDVKAYFLMGATMHDVAISAWGAKGWYDYLRPISALRYMADQGQSSDPMLPSYDPNGITLRPGYIELITSATTAPGERHEHLAGEEGKIALYAWRGPDFIADPETDVAGVGWILAENWWPYQRPSFVTPPFAGYVSGHSTFSRAAAELMTSLTGSEYFPGGVGEFFCPQNDFLVFENGPSVDVTLQWATYQDASDQTSMSRIWGGIHPPADDIPGRLMGVEMSRDAFDYGQRHMLGLISCPTDLSGDGVTNSEDLAQLLGQWGDASDPVFADVNRDEVVNSEDLAFMLGSWGVCP